MNKKDRENIEENNLMLKTLIRTEVNKFILDLRIREISIENTDEYGLKMFLETVNYYLTLQEINALDSEQENWLMLFKSIISSEIQKSKKIQEENNIIKENHLV